MTTTAAAASAASTASGTSQSLATLSSNEQTFLNLLLTQLKNQDPTTPLDTNQFTTELVQYSQVEQQINTNSDLSQLISLTQSDDLLQASSLVGKQVDVSSDKVPLQDGAGIIRFTSSGAQQATVAISNAAGAVIRTDAVSAQDGANTYTWDGTDGGGTAQPDGPYTVSVTGSAAGGASVALPFTVVGTATGIQKQGGALDVQLGKTSVDLGSVVSVIR
jgi:flagellar basal-body rod modification protein FlgD